MGANASKQRNSEHFTKMIRQNMETAAWRSLTPCAQALYPWLKLEWRGPKANNNGRIKFSVRQAADALGVNRKTAAKAFHDLQAKGFLAMVSPARLGLGGQASAPAWEITEIALPGEKARPRNLFRQWSSGNDFPVYRAPSQNPRGINGQAQVVTMKVVK